VNNKDDILCDKQGRFPSLPIGSGLPLWLATLAVCPGLSPSRDGLCYRYQVSRDTD